MIPARGLLLVHPVDTAEVFVGSDIIIPANVRERLTLTQCEVISVGLDEACEDEDCERRHAAERTHPCAVEPGDWLLVRPRSFIDSGELGAPRWFVRQRDVLAVVRS